ncbi:MAG: hypothetical protein FD155_2410 [Bacteroidetes bacterium]|jgi:hypothetical protein|nr:MAG: hypothetical protein FD155_2410 [Bacteroidota bacterium]
MKFYDSDSEFTFGKYEGKTIKEVFEQDPKYIDFCFNNIDEFYVSPDVMKELRSLDPRFTAATTSNEEFDDDLFESYLDEAELVEEIDDPYLDEDEGGNWDDEDDLGLDDDFDSFDDYREEDDY